MKSIQALRERKTEISRAANHLLAEKGAQTWSKEDQAAFDNHMDEIERVDSQISAHQRMVDVAALDTPQQRTDAGKPVNEGRQALEIFLRKSAQDQTPDEVRMVRNTMSTTTGSQGGYTVQPQVAKDVVNAMKDYGGIRRVAGQITTETGVDLSYPTSDGTSEMGEIVAQNVTAATADPSFGTVSLNVFKFGSKTVAVPIELIQDSSIDIIGFVQQRLRDRIGRIQNLKFSQGTGTGEPFGLATAAGVGKVGPTGQTTTITYDDLVDMVESLDVAYLNNSKTLSWMLSQPLRKVLRKLKDGSNRPIWTPSYDAGLTGTKSDLLLDFPVNINNDMPAPGANAKSLTFGAHDRYMVRDAMVVSLFRFEDSAFMTKGQVGFLGWCRAGGNLLDVNAVKAYQHSAT